MLFSVSRTVLFVFVILLGACREAEVPEPPEAVASNEALQQMYEEDQQDRAGWAQLSDEQRDAVFARDRTRRTQVADILAAGGARTADDYYHAAMVFQHGEDSTDYLNAHQATRQALALDSTHAMAGWLSAATWDRYQLAVGKPQWYGTQYLTQNGLTTLQPIDTTRVTDQERQRLGVLSLQQTRALIACTNSEPEATLPDCMRKQLEANAPDSDG